MPAEKGSEAAPWSQAQYGLGLIMYVINELIGLLVLISHSVLAVMTSEAISHLLEKMRVMGLRCDGKLGSITWSHCRYLSLWQNIE